MFFRGKKNGLKPIYTMHSIEAFAMSLIGIFIPIYFLTLGYTISSVLIFFIVHYGFLALFSFLAIFFAIQSRPIVLPTRKAAQAPKVLPIETTMVPTSNLKRNPAPDKTFKNE